MRFVASFDLEASQDSLFNLLPKDLVKDISVTAEGEDLIYIVYSNDNTNFVKTEKKLTKLLGVWAKSKKAKVQLEESDSDIGLIVYKVYVELENLDDSEKAHISVKSKKRAGDKR